MMEPKAWLVSGIGVHDIYPLAAFTEKARAYAYLELVQEHADSHTIAEVLVKDLHLYPWQ